MNTGNCAFENYGKDPNSPLVLDAGADAASAAPPTKSLLSEVSLSRVTSNDVLLGRGALPGRHSGNKRLRALISRQKSMYENASGAQRDDIVRDIIGTVRSNGGRFLRRESQTGEWKDEEEHVVQKKIYSALRETVLDRKRIWSSSGTAGNISAADFSMETKRNDAIGQPQQGFQAELSEEKKKTAIYVNQDTTPLTSNSNSSTLQVLKPPAKKPPPTSGMLPIPGVNPEDILLARSGRFYYHIGNERLFDTIMKQRPAYAAAFGTHKQDIVRDIVQKVQNDGGRFLKRDHQTGGWKDVDNEIVYQKVGLALSGSGPPSFISLPNPNEVHHRMMGAATTSTSNISSILDPLKQDYSAHPVSSVARKPPPQLKQDPSVCDLTNDSNTISKHDDKLSQEEQDRQLALMLSSEEVVGMLATNTGRALSFVQRVIDIVGKLNANLESDSGGGLIQPVAKDDMVYLAERLLNTQESFINEARPYTIDLGYHYTKDISLATIKTDGLLTKKEITDQGKAPGLRLSGSYFGNGVYTANNPFTFQKFGDVGLLVARLKGWCLERGRKRLDNDNEAHGYDTVIGNKRMYHGQIAARIRDHDEIVLRTSAQTLPLLQFPKYIIHPQSRDGGNTRDHRVSPFQRELQELVDEYFNTPRQLSAGPWPSSAVGNPADDADGPFTSLEPTPTGPSGMSPSSPTMPFSSSMLAALLSPPSPPPAAAAAAAAAAFPPPAQSHAAASPSSNPFPSRRPISPSAMLPFNSSLPPVGSPTTVGAVMNWASPKKQAPLPLKSSSSPKKPPPLPPLPPLPPSLLALPVTPAPAPAVPPPNTNGPTVTGGPQQTQRQQQQQMPQQRVRSNVRNGRYSFIGGRNRNDNVKTYVYTAPDKLRDASKSLDTISQPRPCGPVEDCPICLDPMLPLSHPDGAWFPSCKLKPCGHGVHIKCLVGVMAVSNKCPICRTCLGGPPQGHSPSGTMEVTKNPHSKCDGHPEIKICYILQGGTQKAYHDNPGVPYRSERREAYLPDTPDGNRLLRRLIYAFRHGLTFRVGTSLTTGRKNCITWASIHHKTSRHGGVHGYPDPSYFMNCNDELDRLNVPTDPPVPKDPPKDNNNSNSNIGNLKSP